MKKLETIAEKFLLAAGLLLFTLLTAASFVFTRYFAEDFSTELPYSRSDLFFWAAAGAVLLGGLIVSVKRKDCGWKQWRKEENMAAGGSCSSLALFRRSSLGYSCQKHSCIRSADGKHQCRTVFGR